MQKARKLLLLGIGLTAMAAWSLPASAGEEGGGEAKPKEAAKGEGGEEGGKKDKGASDVSGGRFAGDPVYVHMSPMILPVITDQGAEQLVTIMLDVQVKDFDVADSMHTNMPRINDALMRALYGGLGQGTLRNGKLVDISRIKAKANAAVSSVVGGDGVKDVLVQGVSQRML